MGWILGIFLKTKIYFIAQTAEYLKKNINQLFLQKILTLSWVIAPTRAGTTNPGIVAAMLVMPISTPVETNSDQNIVDSKW